MNIAVKIALIVLILGVLTGSIVVVYAGETMPVLNQVVTVPFIEKSPDTVIDEMQLSMLDVSTAQYSLHINGAYNDWGPAMQVNVQAVYQGQLYPLLRGTLVVTSEIDTQALRVFSDIQARLTDEWVYTRVSEVPGLPFLNAASIDGVWYRFPNESVKLMTPSRISGMPRFHEAVRLPDDDVDGITTYHLQVQTDAQQLSGLFPGVQGILPDDQPIGCDVWIGKDDFRLYAVKSIDTSISVSLSVSEYGTSVTVEEPLDAKPFEEFAPDLFQDTNVLDLPVFGSLLGLDLGDMAADTDGDQLYTIWEYAFHSNPDTADTDGDGFSDGEEVRHGYNPNGNGRLFPFPENTTASEGT